MSIRNYENGISEIKMRSFDGVFKKKEDLKQESHNTVEYIRRLLIENSEWGSPPDLGTAG